MRILISGFEPFGGHAINPTEYMLEAIQNHSFADIGVELRTVLLPVHYDECVDLLVREAEAFQPNAIIMCGLAAGRTAVSLERIAVNVKSVELDAEYADNRNDRPKDMPIREGGADGLLSTLPIRKMTDRLLDNGIPAVVSNTAGTFICNNTMYGMLDYLQTNRLNVLAGFVHFPASTQMAVHKPSLPSLPMDLMTRALQLIIRTTAEQLHLDAERLDPASA
ncbi:pyroglutamyl-peptidase I [Paenibacillus hunanensis]|uniref:pyroglutamyl-peptidase I n=1 Tax=Paenibacillus hunanensis TaxID=539262 RepID=UPI00202676EA|nr:pyroglutamyl-peptidase I [Paenibacillus hunanensis]MCL9661461.1 pyroglutamyl-peptidase I [Paenibacillus hunanensis]